MSKKAVNALGREKRRMHIIEPLTYYLIICEGTKTEPEYFKEIRSLINAQYDHRVEVRQVEIQIEGEATNTIFLLERAKKYVAELKGQVNQVWLVYDQDDFSPERFDNTSYAANKLSKTGEIQYKTAWSNQCIEYWFLLHFENLQADIDREQYKKKLSQHLRRHGLGEYRKNLTNLFSLLKRYGNLELAIRFAENRLKEFGKQKPSMQRPATKVHELVVDLLKYIPK